MGDVGMNEWLSMMASLAVVLVLLAATLFGLKKMGMTNAANSTKKIHVREVHNLGPRQKLMVVRINNEDVLLGVTPQAINRLGNWPDQQSADEADSVTPIESSESEFKSDNPSVFQKLVKQITDRKEN
jgi:flagellar protein FliO/FliZ